MEYDLRMAELDALLGGLEEALQGSANGLANVSSVRAWAEHAIGVRPGVENTDWSLVGSVYYVFTVITTIGYGRFAPSTLPGRVCTLLFAVLGIGLLGVSLHTISAVVDEMVNRVARACANRLDRSQKGRVGPRHVENDSEFKSETRRLKIKTVITVCISFLMWILSAVSFRMVMRKHGEQWSYFEAFYYSAITFLTIGLGDFTVNWTGDSAWPAVLLFILLTSFGLVLFAVLVHIAAAAILLGAREINKLKVDMQQRIRHKRGSIHGNAHDGHPRRRSGSRHGVAMHGSHGVANGVANGGSHGLARHAEYVVEDMTATEFSDGRGVVGTQVPAVLSQEALLEAERSIAALMTQVSEEDKERFEVKVTKIQAIHRGNLSRRRSVQGNHTHAMPGPLGHVGLMF